MYNRVGRGLLIVGRQFRQKLCENTSTATGAVDCAATVAASHCAPSNYVLHRNYCNKSFDESTVTPPKLLSPDEEAEIKMKEFLSVPENQRMQKIIELEIEVMRQSGERVPASVKPRHWVQLVALNTRSKRARFLDYVWVLEKRRENERKIKEEKNKKHEEDIANQRKEPPIYKLGKNTMFLRFYDTSINFMWNNRLINRMMFGQKIVLDCGYEDYMPARDVRNCSKQIQLTFATNRMHEDPFDLYFCNVNMHGELMKLVNRFIPPLYNSEFPINIKTESYLDVFDKKSLIYLTPHCQTEMTEFDHDAVYIIGAYVDKTSNEPVSMAKAKKEGLKMVKFPLDRYLQWGVSSGKNLTINQVMAVLLDLRLTGSWDEALKHVPRRKLYEARMDQMDRKMRRILKSGSSEDEENYSRPVEDLKLKDRLIYKPDRSRVQRTDRGYRSNITRDTGENTEQDFSMKSRAKYRNNWKN